MTDAEIVAAEIRAAEVPMSDALGAALDRLERDADRYRFIRDADRSDDLIPDIGLYAMESLDDYVDDAMAVGIASSDQLGRGIEPGYPAGKVLMTDVPDVMSFPPLPPSPAEVGDLTLQTREHVQAIGWGNREALYTATQVRAVMSECAIMSAARERERHADALRCALEALDYCIEDSAELLSERTAQWGQHRQDRQAAMAATLERHRAVAERLRVLLMAQRRG